MGHLSSKSKRPMHPKMLQRAQLVKEAHIHLASDVPEYKQAGPRQRMMMIQHHVNVRLGKVK